MVKYCRITCSYTIWTIGWVPILSRFYSWTDPTVRSVWLLGPVGSGLCRPVLATNTDKTQDITRLTSKFVFSDRLLNEVICCEFRIRPDYMANPSLVRQLLSVGRKIRSDSNLSQHWNRCLFWKKLFDFLYEKHKHLHKIGTNASEIKSTNKLMTRRRWE